MFNWLRTMLIGRNGVDHLARACLFLSIFLVILSYLTKIPYFNIAALILLLIAYLRVFSKNIPARQRENQKYLAFRASLSKKAAQAKGALGRFAMRVRDRKTHRYFCCPTCRRALRVPRKKGKLRITCPECRTEFVRKT